MKLWQGACLVHENFSERELIKLKTTYPYTKIIAHPECRESILNYADHIGSKSSLINYVRINDKDDFIVLTEPGIIHQMKKVAPNSKFYDVPSLGEAGRASCSACPFMKLNSLEKLYLAMKNMSPQITVPKDIAEKAKLAFHKMQQIEVN